MACGETGVLQGSVRDVVLVYGEDAKFAAGAVYKSLTEVYLTPQPETLFKLKPIKWENFQHFKFYRNKILFLLPYEDLWDMCKESEGVFFRRNVFLRGDFVILVCSYDSREMLSMVSDNLRLMRDTLFSRVIRSLGKIEYFTGINKELSKKVKEKFGIPLKLPRGWKVLAESEDFLALRRGEPDRFIFMYKDPKLTSVELEDLLRLRDSLTAVYYDGDRVVLESVKSDVGHANGKNILKVYGIWENDSLMAGGPFVSLVVDSILLDASVFAPESDNKLQLILRLESVLTNF